MKTNQRITGSIYYIKSDTLKKILSEIFPDIKLKIKIFGENFRYEDEHIEVFIETIDYEEYYVDIFFIDDVYDSLFIREQLLKSLLKYDEIYHLYYFLADENNDTVGEEEMFMHPEFQERYKPHLTSRNDK